MRTLPAGTVTLLFTDIEGSTRLLHEVGPDVYAQALAEHRRVLRGAFAAYGGVEVDTQGDAFFVAFPTAEGAASAAIEGNAALAPGQIRVRMGLHTGTPTVTDDGYVGDAVHQGARIGALAHGGQVLLSAATRALLPDMIEVRDLGRHRLKDFPAAVPVYQLGGEHFPPLRTPGSIDLPNPATPFLGRGRELYDAVGVVLERDPQVLTILGPGGTGKTRFAIELARRLAEDADGGTVFVPLAPVRDPALVLPSIASAVGAASSDLSAVATRIGEKRTHVVLDNLEQLLPDAAVTVARLAAAAPALRLVVTSREALRIGAETQFDLPPLAVEEGVALFLTRARAVRPDVRESPAVETLCTRLDLMPLALELAAARSKLLSPEALLERIGSRLDLLTGSRDADPRHATLRTTIAWSYDLLDDGERALFDRLAVFRGGCTLPSAEAVCAADVATLEALLDKSLLRRRSDDDGSDRFWMHETIREFAAERLAESPAQEQVCRAHATWLVGVLSPHADAAAAEVRRPEELDLAQRELDNVRAALDWSIGNDPGLGLELTVALEEFWVIREPIEGSAWHRKLLDAAQSAPALLRARGLRALGGAIEIVGDPRSAEVLYRASLELIEPLGDEDETSFLRFRIGAAAVNSGDTDRGWPLIEAALVTFRQSADSVRTAQALS
nr:adenylate/guanylate cyclase domain-containing protein [Sporichthyaceae bacterium]